jgi:hypothetical protein
MDEGNFVFLVTCKNDYQLLVHATHLLDCHDGCTYFICEPFDKVTAEDWPVCACHIVPFTQINKQARLADFVVRKHGEIYEPYKIAPDHHNAFPVSCVRVFNKVLGNVTSGTVAPTTNILNLNQQVWVELTEKGRKTLTAYAHELDARLPQSFRERKQSVLDMFPTTHGYTRMQLHDLSAVFPGSRLDAYMDMNMLLNEPTGPAEKAKP